MNQDDPFIDVGTQSATTTTAQVPSSPMERPNIWASHQGAPSIAAIPPLGAEGLIKEPDNVPLAFSILLGSNAGLFILVDLSIISFSLCQTQEMNVPIGFCHCGDGQALGCQ